MKACPRLIASALLLPLIGTSTPTAAFALRAGMEEKVEEELREAFASQAPQAGLEDVAFAARFIRQRGWVKDLAGASDADVIAAFLPRLLPQPHPGPFAQSLMPADGSYHPGPFSRAECPIPEVEEELLPALTKVIRAAAGQMGVTVGSSVMQDLGRLLHGLWDARDAQGSLLLANYDEVEIFRWLAYRDLPLLLAPWLAEQWHQSPAAVEEALKNPFAESNRENNEAMRKTIDEFLGDASSGLTDDPVQLREDPQERVLPWARLMLAANGIDFTRPQLMERIKRDGVMTVVHELIQTEFSPDLGGDRDLRDFIAWISRGSHALVVLPDNNGELVAVLKFVEVLLSINPELTMVMIAKADNMVMNDASVADAQRELREPGELGGLPDIFARLRSYAAGSNPRFIVLPGPGSQGTPLNLVSEEVARAIRHAEAVLSIGEAHGWTLNGIRTLLYLATLLKWAPVADAVYGVSSEGQPKVFVKIDGPRGPYYHNLYGAGGERRTVRETVTQQRAGLEELPVTPEVFAGLIDHTNLDPTATPEDIRRTAQQARDHGYALVAVRPGDPSLWAAEILEGTQVKVGPAIGFRLLMTKDDGSNMTRDASLQRYDIPLDEKVREITDTLTALRGRHPDVGYEIDFVINVKRLLDGDEDYVRQEIETLIQTVRDLERPGEHIVVKVIGENYYLTEAQKRLVYGWAREYGADFVKTSTGYAPTGATEADLRLMRDIVGPDMGVKAAGGIRTLESALAMIRAAAPIPFDSSKVRLGLSASVEIGRAYQKASVARAGLEEVREVGLPEFDAFLQGAGITLSPMDQAAVERARVAGATRVVMIPMSGLEQGASTVRVYTTRPDWVAPLDAQVGGWRAGPNGRPTIFLAEPYRAGLEERPAVAVRPEGSSVIAGFTNFTLRDLQDAQGLTPEFVLAAAVNVQLAGQTIPAVYLVISLTDRSGNRYLAALL